MSTPVRVRRRLPFWLLLALGLGCATPEADWERARAAGTEAAYREFLAKHGRSEFAHVARLALEDLAWETARKGDRADLRNFLRTHEQGSHEQDALRAIDDLNWREAVDEGTYGAYESYLEHGGSDGEALAHAEEAKAALEQLVASADPISRAELEQWMAALAERVWPFDLAVLIAAAAADPKRLDTSQTAEALGAHGMGRIQLGEDDDEPVFFFDRNVAGEPSVSAKVIGGDHVALFRDSTWQGQVSVGPDDRPQRILIVGERPDAAPTELMRRGDGVWVRIRPIRR